jgi:hypothetical protein
MKPAQCSKKMVAWPDSHFPRIVLTQTGNRFRTVGLGDLGSADAWRNK